MSSMSDPQIWTMIGTFASIMVGMLSTVFVVSCAARSAGCAAR